MQDYPMSLFLMYTFSYDYSVSPNLGPLKSLKELYLTQEIYSSVVFAHRIVVLLRTGAQLRPNALDSAQHQQHNIALQNIEQPFNSDLEKYFCVTPKCEILSRF